MTDPTATLTKKVQRAFMLEKRRLMAEMARLRACYGRVGQTYDALDLMAFEDLPAEEPNITGLDPDFDARIARQYQLPGAIRKLNRLKRGERDPDMEAEVAALYREMTGKAGK